MQYVLTRANCTPVLVWLFLFFLHVLVYAFVPHRPTAAARRHRWDTVINTAVAGDEASQHLAVGGIYDRVAAQGGDIALPKINIILNGLQISKFGDSLSSDFLLQISILYRQEFFADRIGHRMLNRERSRFFALHPLWGISISRSCCCSRSND